VELVAYLRTLLWHEGNYTRYVKPDGSPAMVASEDTASFMKAMYAAMYVSSVNNWHVGLTNRGGSGFTASDLKDFEDLEDGEEYKPEHCSLPYLANLAFDYLFQKKVTEGLGTFGKNTKIQTDLPQGIPVADMHQCVELAWGSGFRKDRPSVDRVMRKD
jgi:hypothetical protein